ncbi:MAG: prepilin-type N-terminal cleavage/methylation domain-containing protein [Dethiobacteria bacterium]
MMEKILQALRRLHREEAGFTLIELLIVIAIIAVIAAIAIPTVANRISDAREAADRANVKLLQGLVDMYYIDNGAFPDPDGDWIDLLAQEGYLNQSVESPYPDCPDSGYALEIVRDDPARPVATVTSTMAASKWKGVVGEDEGGGEGGGE